MFLTIKRITNITNSRAKAPKIKKTPPSAYKNPTPTSSPKTKFPPLIFSSSIQNSSLPSVKRARPHKRLKAQAVIHLKLKPLFEFSPLESTKNTREKEKTTNIPPK